MPGRPYRSAPLLFDVYVEARKGVDREKEEKAEDFGAELTPELQAQEERLRAQVNAKK